MVMGVRFRGGAAQRSKHGDSYLCSPVIGSVKLKVREGG